MSMHVSNGMIHVYNESNIEVACFKSMLIFLQYFEVYRMFNYEVEKSGTTQEE